MKKSKLQTAINVSLFAWIGIWFYYLIFNWDVFIVQLNTDLGFKTISVHPFLFFFILGVIGFIILKYINHYIELQNKNSEKEIKNKMSMLEKDIEILKLREALYKLHNEDISKNAGAINELHNKLDGLAKKIANEKENNNAESKPKN